MTLVSVWLDRICYRFMSVRPSGLVVFLLIALALCLLRSVYWLLVGIDHPVLDYYSFRQTQTALSAYWLWHDGFRIAYQTPVLGYPWSIPFEFPFYQWLVALLRWFGVPIDVGGRLLAFGFYIGTLYPLWVLVKALNLDRLAWLATAVLFLASPFYVYWGRTVMVESCALFFSVAALAFIARYLNDESCSSLALAFVSGSLAVLTKSTTFPAYAFLAGVLVLAKGFIDYRGSDLSRARLRVLASALAALAAAILVGALWVWYSDQIKMANPFAVQLTSVNLASWNFGSWDQRFSADLWRKAILDRAVPEIFGSYGVPLAGIAAAAAMQDRRYVALMLAALVGFLLPFLLFTNLHVIHSYYQNANALLGLAAVGIGIAAIARCGQPPLAAVILASLVAGQLAFFPSFYAAPIQATFTNTPIYLISQAVKASIPKKEAILILGNDWSSDVPYYSQRKSLSLPNWMPPPLIEQALDEPEKFLGGRKLGGIVYCTTFGYFGETASLVDAFVRGRQVVAEAGPCKLLSPKR